MKARVKATGEIINAERYGDAYAEVLPSCSERSYPEVYEFDELEFITEPDWRHYRIQAAIAAMQGIIVSDAYADTKIVNNMTYEKSRTKWDNIKIAKAAVAHADALIKELKGGEDGQSD